MSLALILVIVALVMFALDVILWNTIAYRRHLLTPIGGILLSVALLVGAGAIH
jgi:hypothetical protein